MLSLELLLLTSNAFAPTIEKLRKENLYNSNMVHSINQLNFGKNLERYKLLGFGYGAYKLMNTLKNKQRNEDKLPMIYQYYLKIVPTKFRYYNGITYNEYQYTANYFSEASPDRLPLLFFRYDISPITVEYKQSKMPFLTFLINTFAILGGVFTIAGIIYAIIHKSALMLLRKAEINKIA